MYAQQKSFVSSEGFREVHTLQIPDIHNCTADERICLALWDSDNALDHLNKVNYAKCSREELDIIQSIIKRYLKKHLLKPNPKSPQPKTTASP